MSEETTNEVQKEFESIQTAEQMDALKEAVIKNEFEFEHAGKKYRVTAGNFRQRSDARTRRTKKLNELLLNKSFKFEKQLKAELKSVGIDIDNLEARIKKQQKEAESLQETIGKMLTNPDVKEEDFKPFREKIEQIVATITELTSEHANYMENSAESQIRIEYFTYLGFLVLETLVDDKWVRAFSKYEDFLEQNEDLIMMVIYYITAISSGDAG